MDKINEALDSLNQAIQKLEGAVVTAKAQKSEDKEKIDTLHVAVQTAYERINKVLSHVTETQKEEQNDGDSHF